MAMMSREGVRLRPLNQTKRAQKLAGAVDVGVDTELKFERRGRNVVRSEGHEGSDPDPVRRMSIEPSPVR